MGGEEDDYVGLLIGGLVIGELVERVLGDVRLDYQNFGAVAALHDLGGDVEGR